MTHSRSLSSKAADKIQQKGAGDEAAYFNRKDKEAALRLLRKLEQEVKEDVELDQVYKKQQTRLTALLNKHGIKLPDGMYDDLLAWKRGQL